MRPESLSKALHKPHVKAFKAAVKRAWLASETDKAWLVVTGLAQNAASEDVKLKAAKVLLDAAGELTPGDKAGVGPRTLVQIVVQHPTESGQPTLRQLPGVIEAQPIQRGKPDPSNFIRVGRGEGDQ